MYCSCEQGDDLNFVHGTESFSQLRWKLIIKLAPIFISNLCFEAMKDLEGSTKFSDCSIMDQRCELTFLSISCRSLFGLLQDAAASQKNMKSGTTPAGLTVIIWHIPRKAESFSSLSRMFRSDEHLSENVKFKNY